MIIRRAAIALLTICFVLSFSIPAKADIGITDIFLYGPGGSGGTTSVGVSSSNTALIGTSGTINAWQAQSFQVDAGLFSQLTVLFSTSSGTPSGTMTWEIRDENISVPGSILATGTFTPTASALNSINTSSSGLFLYPSTTYWLLLKSTSPQATNVFWQIVNNTADVYSNGQRGQTNDSGATYSIFTAQDLRISITTVLGGAGSSYLNDKISQSFTVGGYVTATAVSLDLKKFGSPTGTITLSIQSDTGNNPSGYNIATGATGTLSESALTTSYALGTITLDDPILLQPGTKYWIVITTDRTSSTDYVAFGSTSDCVEDQYLKVHNQGVWKSESTTGIFEFTLDSTPIQPNANASYVSLTQGYTASLNYSMTGGEVVVIALLSFISILTGFSYVRGMKRS